MNIFIDTNVYLTFYSFSKDVLEELKKLGATIEAGKIKVILTDQVVNEYKRNRENKISEALSAFNDQKIPDKHPQLIRDYPEYQNLLSSKRDFSESKDKLLTQVLEDIKNKSLAADKIIEDLFSKSVTLNTTNTILAKAKERMYLGNPPGKNNSIGDAINWECLLHHIPNNENLYIIAQDSDYVSPVDNTSLSTYLNDEWNEKKESQVYLYAYLSDFFTEHFPEIKFASDLEKNLAISNLSTSPNYATTHKAIAKLNQFTSFSEDELNQLVDAVLENSQVFAISNDDDVRAFYFNLMEKNNLSEERLNQLKKIYSESRGESEDPDNIPF